MNNNPRLVHPVVSASRAGINLLLNQKVELLQKYFMVYWKSNFSVRSRAIASLQPFSIKLLCCGEQLPLKTLTELEANYRELIKREHPDVSPFPSEKALERFAYLRSLYRITREHWQQLKPTTAISPTELKKRMIAPVPFAPESFWAA